MCPGKTNFLKTISRSTRTVTQRVKDIGSSINSHFLKIEQIIASGSPWVLMNSQMLPILFSCFLRVNAEFNVMEELACMNSL